MPGDLQSFNLTLETTLQSSPYPCFASQHTRSELTGIITSRTDFTYNSKNNAAYTIMNMILCNVEDILNSVIGDIYSLLFLYIYERYKM